MATVRDLFKDTLNVLGAVSASETPRADELTDGIRALNRMLASWSNESLLIFSKLREVFPLVVGQQTYTMGPAANFNTIRPQKIENALIQLLTTSPVIELPLDLWNKDQWASIVIKTTQSSVPRRLYNESTYPNETINLWPIPSAANNLILYSWKPLVQVATADDTFSLPPGYEDAILYNWAIRLAPSYGKTITQEIASIASESKANIKRMNSKPEYLVCDPGVLTRSRVFNILTGSSGN